jgi:uncharacterized damage-inducible protein DinB
MSPKDALVNPAFVRTMAAYNAEMNSRLYAAAGRLSSNLRTQSRGAFWRSIEGTLCHLLWGDQTWMSRFDGWPKPSVTIKDSDKLYTDFDALTAARRSADEKISAWAGRVDDAWLADDLVWFSGAAQREIKMQKSLLVVHLFNHQTHHRGQAHAMVTAAGEQTGDTDLFLVVSVS